MCAGLCFYPQIHKRIPGRYADARPPILPGEGSKQSQVSALPERRVKKQRLTALLGSYEHLRMLIFYFWMLIFLFPDAHFLLRAFGYFAEN